MFGHAQKVEGHEGAIRIDHIQVPDWLHFNFPLVDSKRRPTGTGLISATSVQEALT